MELREFWKRRVGVNKLFMYMFYAAAMLYFMNERIALGLGYFILVLIIFIVLLAQSEDKNG